MLMTRRFAQVQIWIHLQMNPDEDDARLTRHAFPESRTLMVRILSAASLDLNPGISITCVRTWSRNSTSWIRSLGTLLAMPGAATFVSKRQTLICAV